MLWTKNPTNRPAWARTASSSPTAGSSAPPPPTRSPSTRKRAKRSGRCTLTRNGTEGIDMAPGYNDGLVYVSTVPTTASATYERRGVGDPLGARRAKPAKKCGTSTPSRKTSGATRKSTPAAASGTHRPSTSKGSIYFGIGNPAPFPGTPQIPLGIEPSGPQPLHQLDRQARRENRQDGVVLPADAARHLRLGLPGPADPDQAGGRDLVDRLRASRGSSRRSTPKPASWSGNDRSAPTTATMKTACYAMRGEYSKIKAGDRLSRRARRRDRADGRPTAPPSSCRSSTSSANRGLGH